MNLTGKKCWNDLGENSQQEEKLSFLLKHQSHVHSLLVFVKILQYLESQVINCGARVYQDYPAVLCNCFTVLLLCSLQVNSVLVIIIFKLLTVIAISHPTSISCLRSPRFNFTPSFYVEF